MIMSVEQARKVLQLASARELDDWLGHSGFHRRRRPTYIRQIPEGRQGVELLVQRQTLAASRGEAQILPWVFLEFPEVGEIALQMLKDKSLLANRPSLILRQPVDLTAPKTRHRRWLFSDAESAVRATASLRAFLDEWVLPFLDEYRSVDAFCEGVEQGDGRILRQPHLYVFIAAAYIVKGHRDRAERVLSDRLSDASLRQRFAPAFEYLGLA